MTASTFLFNASLAYYDASNGKWSQPPFFATAPALGPYDQAAQVPPGESLTLFSGQRTITADTTTIFTMTLSPIPVDPIYRFSWTSGTAPGLHTDRGINLSSQTVTVTLNSNETVTIVANSGSFTAVQVGDQVFVPGTLTGDAAGPFNAANTGFWTVLSKAGSTTLTLARRTGESFSGISESVTVAAASDFQVASPGPVQRGDGVDVLAGFSAPILRIYTVREVTATWFEVVASDPLPTSEVGTGGTPPAFYTAAKRLIWVMVDQEATVTVNGGTPQRVSPLVAGQVPGFFIASSPVYSLAVANRSAQTMKVSVRGVS